MSTMGERIRSLRKQKGLTLEELGAYIGVQKSAVGKYEKGAVENIKRSSIEKMSILFNVSPSYLMGLEESKSGNYLPSNILPMPTTKYPLIGTIAAGTPIIAEHNIEEYVTANADIKADFCLHVKGNSMIGANIFDKNIVFIREQPTVNNGEIAAVLIDEEATLKRFYKRGNNVTLTAENPEFEPLIFTEENFVNVRVLGKAVAVLREI